MHKSFWLIAAFLMASCQSGTAPPSQPDLLEHSPYSAWPSVTEQPVQVGADVWVLCRGPTPEEAAKYKLHGPHASYSIIVRVNPEAIALFRDGSELPTGSVVVKEKYVGIPPSATLPGYAVMTKREAGYFPEGGDWEYEFVALVPERKETRGRLANCAACHASAKEHDFLFRSYGDKLP